MDDKVQGIFGQNLADYFAHHKIQYKPLVYKGNEVDKEIASVEQILVDLKKNGISRYVIMPNPSASSNIFWPCSNIFDRV